MTYYSQTDPRWSSMKIGSSNSIVHDFGCAITAFCNGINAVCGTNWTPDKIASNSALFVAGTDGQKDILDWAKACAFTGKLKYNGSETYQNDKNIKAALKNPNTFCILYVNNNHHFVLATKSTLTGSYMCLDSWDGKIKDVKKAYHNITGARYFEKK